MDHYIINHQSLITFRNTASITIGANEAEFVFLYPTIDLLSINVVLFGVIYVNPNGIPNIIANPGAVYVDPDDKKISLRANLYNTSSFSFTLAPGELHAWVSIGKVG